MTLSKGNICNELIGVCYLILVDHRAVKPRDSTVSPIVGIVATWSRTVSNRCEVPNFPDLPMRRHLPQLRQTRLAQRYVRIEATRDRAGDERPSLLRQ